MALPPDDKALILEAQALALAAIEAEVAAGGGNTERLRGLFNGLGQAVYALKRVEGPLTPAQRRGFQNGVEIMRSMVGDDRPSAPAVLLS